MKKIKAEKITAENFKLLGAFFKLSEAFTQKEIDGDWIPYLFRTDLLTQTIGKTDTTAAFSIGLVKKRPMIVKKLEYHNFTEKTILMEKDAIMLFTNLSADTTPPLNSAKAVMIPAGTAVKLYTGIWYSEPFVINADKSFYMHCEAQRAYIVDIHTYELADDEQFEIVL